MHLNCVHNHLLIALNFHSGWIVKAADNGPQFEDVDLSDDDWVEYDNKNKVSIGIYEFESNFIKLKK